MPNYPVGQRLIITGNSNGHEFYMGEEVEFRGGFGGNGKDLICWHLHKADYWFVRPTECRPVNLNSIKFKKKRGA